MIKDNWDIRATLVSQEALELRDFRAPLVPSAPADSREVLVRKDQLDLPVLLEQLEILVSKDHKVPPDNQDQLDPLVLPVHPVKRVTRDRPVHKEIVVPQVSAASLVVLDLREPKDRLVKLEVPEMLDRMDQ